MKEFVIRRVFALSRKSSISFAMSVSLSVCLSVPMFMCVSVVVFGRILWNLKQGKLTKICWENPNLIKIGQNIRQFTSRRKYILSFSKEREKHNLWPGVLGTFRISRDRRLLTSPWLSAHLPVDEFSWNLVLGTLRNSDKKLQICWKLKENVGHFTWG